MRRIECIDGLRGIAILCVILYHAFSRWAAVTPYGAVYARTFGWGWLGVELFFIISGFVISMTLDRCLTFGEFMGKRWLRLFPAMLIASLLIYATAPLIPRPLGTPNAWQLVPGLTFIDAKWWALVHGPDSLEGSFWSLYAEMKFYVFAGAVYFALGKRWVVPGLLAGFVGYWAAVALHIGHLTDLGYMLDVTYWGWFACGALFYEGHRSEDRRLLVSAIAVGAIASLAPPPTLGYVPNTEFFPMIGFPFVLLFAGALTMPWVQRALSNRLLLLIGFVSYPLYLIHEQALVGLIRIFRLSSIEVVFPAALLVGVAWLIAKCEPLVRAVFTNGLPTRRIERAL